MASFQSEKLGRAGNIAVVLVQLLQDKVALVGGASIVERCEISAGIAPNVFAVHERWQVFAFELRHSRVHYDDAF